MTEKFQYQYGILPGRFQIIKNSTLDAALSLLSKCEQVIIIIGSSNQSRDTRNPFSGSDRIEMWLSVIPQDVSDRFHFITQEDVGNRAKWTSQVEQKVHDLITKIGDNPEKSDVAIFGQASHPSNYYLDDFKHWPLEEIADVDDISASELRKEYFSIEDDRQANEWFKKIKTIVPEPMITSLIEFRNSDHYQRLSEEASRAEYAMKPFSVRTEPNGPGLPYPITIVTTEAVIVQGNRILLQRRKQYPGKGLWALVGGVIDENMSAVESALKHLVKKTSIDLTITELRRSVTETWIKDDPKRSAYGRRLSIPVLIRLDPIPRGKTPSERRKSVALPRVRASEDTHWFTFQEVREIRDQIMEDHAVIIDQAVDRLGVKNPY